jgi:hypothetical protein
MTFLRRALTVGLLLSTLGAPVAQAQEQASAPSKTRAPAAAKLPKGRITASSLRAFIKARFPEPVKSGRVELDFGSEGVSDEILVELKGFGIRSLQELAALIPEDFDTRGAVAWEKEPTTIAGLLRDFMMLKDLRRYISKSWKPAHWTASSEDEFPVLKAYGINLKPLHEAGVISPD